MKKVLLFALLLLMTACSHVDLSLTDQTRIIRDEPVRKSPLQVSVHPKGKQYRPLTAYFHPFVIQQQNSDYDTLANSFAQIFHAAWTEERLFPTQAFIPGRNYRGVNHALDKARRQGADLLILGFVPYFYAGHTLDDTAITIKINIYSAGNGTLLWSMAQSGRITHRDPKDWIYFKTDQRLPDSPFNMIIRALAKDMAIPLKAWLPDPDTEFQFADTAEDVEKNLMMHEEATTPEAPLDAEAMTSDGQIDGQAAKNSMDSSNRTNSMNDMDAPVTKTTMDDMDTPPVDGQPERPQVGGVNLDILFKFDKDEINPESYPKLDALGEALNSPELKGKNIIIGGHTDAIGTEAYNMTLSKRRAQMVKSYLVNKWGIDPNLIEAVGYGKSRPITEGKTKADLQKNRRVEIRLAR